METLNQRPDIICKLVIIGDTGVGKTCVMRRFTDDEFSYNFVATIGELLSVFGNKSLEFKSRVELSHLAPTIRVESYFLTTRVSLTFIVSV